MAADNKLELVVEVDTDKANASIKSINSGLSSIESTAAKAARGASQGIDGITVSMSKGVVAGNLFADAIKGAIEKLKEWTIGAAQMAAHEVKLEASGLALAKAHGVASAEFTKTVEAVRKIGYHGEEAIHAVTRLMVADMDLSKAQGLAKIAKDAAAIENIAAGEALDKLLLAIESGASRGLRTMGIFVDLQKEVQIEELKRGKTLDESETKQIRYNAVLREAVKIQGAAAGASGTAEAQAKALAREATELKEAVGAAFQDQFRSLVGHLRELVRFLEHNTDWIAKFGQVALWLSGALATAAIATKISGIAASIGSLGAALAANPLGLLAGGAILAGAAIYKTYSDTQEQLQDRWQQQQGQQIRNLIASGKSLDELRKMGLKDEEIKVATAGHKALPGESFEVSGPKLNVDRGPDLDALKLGAEIHKKQGDALKSANELYMRAMEERKSAEHDVTRQQIEDSMKVIEATQSEATAARESLNVILLSRQEYAAGVAKLREEERREIAQRSSFVDEKGVLHRFKLDPAVLEKVHEATAEKIAAFDIKFNEEQARRLEQMWKALGARLHSNLEQYVIEPVRQDLALWQQSFELDEKRQDQQLGIEKSAVQQRRDLSLAQLDAIDTYTLRDKVALEQTKTQIEIQAICERTAIELQEIERRTEHDIREAERAAYAKGIFDEERISQITSRIRTLGDQEKAATRAAMTSEVSVAEVKGAAATKPPSDTTSTRAPSMSAIPAGRSGEIAVPVLPNPIRADWSEEIGFERALCRLRCCLQNQPTIIY